MERDGKTFDTFRREDIAALLAELAAADVRLYATIDRQAGELRAAEARETQLRQALNDACDVGTWLSALVGWPDGASDPAAAETWQNVLLPLGRPSTHRRTPDLFGSAPERGRTSRGGL